MQHTERQDYQTKINKLNSSNHRGFSFRKRIKLLQQWFTAFLQLRKSLVKLNTSTILENVEKSARLNNLATEAEKLLSADKILNFTNIELPQDFKGTNFVPTLDNTNVKSVKDTITNEVNEALCTLIRKEKPSSSTLKVKTAKTKNRFKPYSTLHPTTLLKQQQNRPSFNVHLIDYVHNTVSSTKQFLHSTDLRTYVNVNHCNANLHQASYVTQLRQSDDTDNGRQNHGMGVCPHPLV